MRLQPWWEVFSVAARLVQNVEQEQFELYVGEDLAAFSDYMDMTETRNFSHTVTYPRFQDQGLATELIRYALDVTRRQGLKIVPSCSFVAEFIEGHGEYRDLVA